MKNGFICYGDMPLNYESTLIHGGKLVWERNREGVKGRDAHYGLDCQTGETGDGKCQGQARDLPIQPLYPLYFYHPSGKPELIFTNWWLGLPA